MLFATAGQFPLFLWMVGAGVAVGALYSLCAGLRRLLSAGFWLTLAADAFFGLAAALTLIVFICVTRLYLGVHWVTDVIAGFSVGLGSSMILAPFMIGPNALKLFR